MKIKFLVLFVIFSNLAVGQSKLEIKDVWARPAARGANSALFFTIENNGSKADTLVAVEFKLADIVQIHETYKKDNNKVGMRPIDFVAVAPKSKVKFKPVSLHVMILDVHKDFKLGSPLEAVLRFKHSGKIKVKAVVQDMPAMGGMKH